MFRGPLALAAVLLVSMSVGYFTAGSYVGGSALQQAEPVVHNHGYTRRVSSRLWRFMWWSGVANMVSLAGLIVLFPVAWTLYHRRVTWYMRWRDHSYAVLGWWWTLFIAAFAAALIWPLGWRGHPADPNRNPTVQDQPPNDDPAADIPAPERGD